MILSGLVLFVATMLGGLMYLIMPKVGKNLSLPLIFVGSYLFAITIIHLIPELFTISEEPTKVGLFILLGFFVQQILEYFSSGIEHGHFHSDQVLSGSSRISITVALLLHSLLEGSVLTHDSPFHEKHESYSLLLGIVLHKMPAAFALMVTMNKWNKTAFLLLLIFSLASPIGMVFGNLLDISTDLYLVVFAIVCGSFLHISTTIFVETSPNHRLGFNKMMVSVLGAALAIVVELFG